LTALPQLRHQNAVRQKDHIHVTGLPTAISELTIAHAQMLLAVPMEALCASPATTIHANDPADFPMCSIGNQNLAGLGVLGLGTGRCIHAIMTATGTKATATHMTPDDLPELFAFLTSNGYTVDTGLTKLAAKHQSGDAGALVCIVSYVAATST